MGCRNTYEGNVSRNRRRVAEQSQELMDIYDIKLNFNTQQSCS